MGHCWNTIYRETHQVSGGIGTHTENNGLYVAFFTCSDVCGGGINIMCMMSVDACQETIFLILGILIGTILFCIIARKTGLCACILFCLKKDKRRSKRGHKHHRKYRHHSSSDFSSSGSSSSDWSSSSYSSSDDDEKNTTEV